jgi:SSS family solute:Na+ symporter
MAGSAFGRVGLAIASYEWMAAITLVIVAWWLLPKFSAQRHLHDARVSRIPLQRRDAEHHGHLPDALYIFALLATVLYSGSQRAQWRLRLFRRCSPTTSA